MNDQLKELLDTIVGNVFGYKNPFTPEQFMEKFAFDVNLPKQVTDFSTGETTWAQSVTPARFMKHENSVKLSDSFVLPKRKIENINEVLKAWQEMNFAATERYMDSENCHESDNINRSRNVFRSQDINDSNNIAFSNGLSNCEFVAACHSTRDNNYSIRIEDSKECSKSFNVQWSAKITNSMFIQDCYDMFECLFCSHMAGKKYCIANMQFEKEEYFALKKKIVEWILTS